MATPRSTQPDAGLRRDAGLDKLGRATRWVAVGGVALVGVFSAIAAKGLPGHGTSTSKPPAAGTSTQPSGTQSGDTSGGGIQGPSQAPVQSQAPPVATSGGS